MAEIYINIENLENVIKTFSEINKTFALRSFGGGDKKKRCHCFINGNECKIDFYIKNNNTLKVLPVGKNIESSNLLIEHVASLIRL